MSSLLQRLRAWRKARRERYAEQWAATQPYDSRADKYLPPHRPDSFPPTSGTGN
jgi:hypothetical protein